MPNRAHAAKEYSYTIRKLSNETNRDLLLPWEPSTGAKSSLTVLHGAKRLLLYSGGLNEIVPEQIKGFLAVSNPKGSALQ